MSETLNEALHARLDRMGAPPRETPQVQAPAETPVEAVLETADPAPESDLVETPEGLDGDAEAPEPAPSTGEIPEKYRPATLAEAIGWTAEDLYNSLEIPIGSDGETLTLGQIKDQYGEIAAKRAEVEAAQQQIRAAYEQLQNQALQGPQQIDADVQEAAGRVESIGQQYAQIDWDQLDETDPGRAANLRQKFATAYSEAKTKLEEAQQKAQATQQQAMQQFMQAQQQRALELVPEWRDQEKFKEENPQISAYALSRGFAPQEISTLYHAGLRAVLRDGWLWQQHQAKVKQASGKMRAAPKPVLRPGGPPAPAVADVTRDNLMSRARQTGREQDKLAAARAIVQSSQRR